MKRKCSNCNHENISREAKFCPNCGSQLPEELNKIDKAADEIKEVVKEVKYQVSTSKTVKKTYSWIKVLVIFSFIGLVLLLLIEYIQTQEKYDSFSKYPIEENSIINENPENIQPQEQLKTQIDETSEPTSSEPVFVESKAYEGIYIETRYTVGSATIHASADLNSKVLCYVKSHNDVVYVIRYDEKYSYVYYEEYYGYIFNGFLK